MKLKTRLWISFGCIILLPILLIGASANLLIQYQLRVIDQTYSVESSIEDIFPNSTRLFNRMMAQMQETIRRDIELNPDNFLKAEYLNQLGNTLKQKGSYLVVRKADTVIFDSGNLENIYRYLPEDTENSESYSSGTYIGGDRSRLVKGQNIEFSDGTEGTVFIVMEVDTWIPELKVMIIELVLVVIAGLVVTAGVFIYWIYRSILKPMNILKDAAKNIKEGNLDFKIEANEKDELGELCTSFEEMRVRLKESAEEKVEFDKESKELISNISHDLKTPITAIKGYVEGIIDGVADTPEKMERYFRTIYNKANDMDRLINELTFYSKIDTNRIPYTFSKINVKDYFSDCVEEVQLDMESRNIEFGFYNYCDESIVVIADAEQLKRVINNIISNSIKYFDKPKGKINIRIKDVGDFIQVEIEDNGKGIAQRDLPYIFERFYRTDSSRNSSKGGSGIGLAIVKKIIEDHGGRIWATSKEGTGTIMYFVLRKYQEVINE